MAYFYKCSPNFNSDSFYEFLLKYDNMKRIFDTINHKDSELAKYGLKG